MSIIDESQAVRQQIYERIRQSSKQEYVLEEMIRLGFWPRNENHPTLPEQVLRVEGELTRELNDLLEKQRKYQNQAQMLKEMRKKRLEDSRKKQAETKERHKRERAERAAQWETQKIQDIGYLGEGVSGGLNEKTAAPERLQANQVPAFAGVAELAQAMELSVGELRFLAYHRNVSKTSHYKRFYMPKKSGGLRLISAPMPRLKTVQQWILANVLQNVPVHPAAHGFLPEHSIVSNAAPHVGQSMVINLDVKDFFPSVTYRRVKGLFRSLGYSEQLATVLALLCTASEVDEVLLDGETFYVAKSERHLPQGAPTSPALTNILCRRMDSRLQGVATKSGWTYTRYADDITFSGSEEAAAHVTQLLWQVKQIITDEGFVLHPDKLRIMRIGSRQEVTGIVVNERAAIKRATLNKFRALLFQVEKDGLEGKTWNGSPVSFATLKGFANYVYMVSPAKGQPLLERVNTLMQASGT